MPIALVQTTEDVDLCHTDDPSVTAPEGLSGWVPAAACATSDDATIITVRPLNGWEMRRARGLLKDDDQTDFLREVIGMGLIAINGDERLASDFIEHPDPEQLFGVFNAITEVGAHPLPRGRDSES